MKIRIFILVWIFLSFPMLMSAQEPCDRINITQASRKPDFNTFLSSVRNAVIWVDNSKIQSYYAPAFNALREYLRAMGFERVETKDFVQLGGMTSECETVAVQINFSWSTNGVFSNIRMTFSYDEGYEWNFSTGTTARNQSEFLNALRNMHGYNGYRKPAFNRNNIIQPIKRKTCWTETRYRSHVTTNGCDAIEGIYQSASGGVNYRVALRKMNNRYHLIYLSGAGNTCNWDEGEIKAYLEPTATPMLFSGRWIMASKAENNNCFISFEPGLMNVILNGEKDIYVKLFPAASDNFASSETTSSGTGFALSSNGYIVTNHHVIDKARTIEVKGVNGNFTRKYSAEVVASDERNDLAIIKINDPGFTTLGTVPYTFRQGVADVGENIFVLGYPMITSMGEEIKLTNGIVSSRTGYQGDISMYQISAPVQPGNSGGPLFDRNGNIIGIVNAKHTLAENAGYAIKVNYIMNLIELLPQRITLPRTSLLNGKVLTEQVRIASNHVYLIVINDKSNSPSSNSGSSGVRTQQSGASSSAYAQRRAAEEQSSASSSGNTQQSGNSSTSNAQQPNNSTQNALDYYQKAGEAWDKQNIQEALENINKSIEFDPYIPEAYIFRGYIYGDGIGNFDKAIEDFTKVIQMNYETSIKAKNDALAYFYRAMSYIAKNNYAEAIKDFTQCISLDNKNLDAYYSRGLAKSALGDRRGAINDYDFIINYRGDNSYNAMSMATVYNNKAYCLVELNELAEALPLVNKALELDNTKAYIWDTRGEYYYRMGEYEKCIQDMNKAIAIQESDNSYYYRGLAKIKLGQKTDGCFDLSKAGELGKSEAYNAISEHCK